jgi:hypothetical protein
VYSDPKMSAESALGISQGAARVAINETAYSRMALSLITISTPSIMILSLERSRMIRRAIRAFPKLKFAQDAVCIIFALQVGLPLACSIFESTSSSKGEELEPSFHAYEKVYFNKGL